MLENEIIVFCKKHNIFEYNINADMSIDVNENVILNIPYIPIKFNKIIGYAHLSLSNKLLSLKNGPEYVDDYFNCGSSKLTSLEYCPKYVGGGFYCNRCKFTSLDGLPVNFYIGGDFHCLDSKVKTPIDYGKLFLGYIGGNISVDNWALMHFLNEYKNPPKKDLPKILSELRKIKL